MTLNLNREHIRNCNNNSQHESGSVLARDAERMFSRFDDQYGDVEFLEGLTEEQYQFLEERRASYKGLVEKAFNDILEGRAKFVPWNVSGRANYPVERMRKIGDRNMEKSIEWQGKMDRFLENTRKMLEDLTPLEKVLERYRSGKWKHGEVIKSSDPHVIEKLNAKLEFLEEYQEKMKLENRIARKEKKGRAYMPYELSNNLASIKAIRKRIDTIEAMDQIEGFDFEGGRVVANQEAGRLQILFDEKPDEEIRNKLKRNSFRWAPSQKAWQRQLTKNSIYAAKRFVKEISEEGEDEI